MRVTEGFGARGRAGGYSRASDIGGGAVTASIEAAHHPADRGVVHAKEVCDLLHGLYAGAKGSRYKASLADAIRDGQDSEPADRDAVFRILEGQA
jgi:hypothetical protein